MKHIHHIIPKHMGGTEDPTNLIELSVEEHAQAHLKLYETYGKKEDLCAYYMLSGKSQDPEFKKLVCSLGGKASYNRRKELGIAHLPFFGKNLTKKEKKDICSKGGKVQGKRNAESGHMAKIQKLSNPAESGKKGGATTIARGKGSFGNPVERLKSASKGGKIQGKRNAESGHLKAIAKMSIEENPRSKGKLWITNGTKNKMILPTDLIPEGFRKGKTQKK
jgi:hypothetical protein